MTGKAWIACLLGVAILGFAGYSLYMADGDHAVVARDKLAKVSGKVESAAEVTVTATRRGRQRTA